MQIQSLSYLNPRRQVLLALAIAVLAPAMGSAEPSIVTSQVHVAAQNDIGSAQCDPLPAGDFCLTLDCVGCRGAYGVGDNELSFNLTDAAVQLATGGYGHCVIDDINPFISLSQSKVSDLLNLQIRHTGNATQVYLYTPISASCGTSLDVNFNDEAGTPANSCPATGPVDMQTNDPLSDFDGDRVDSTWTFSVGNNGPSTGSITSMGFAASLACATHSTTGCTPDATTVCLNNNRFKVTMTYQAPSQPIGNGHANTFTADTGWFWFFTSTNVEAVVKVLNGCGVNGHYWVFASGLTNVRVTMTVEDTQTHQSRSYINEQGLPFAPIQDTSAFATCP